MLSPTMACLNILPQTETNCLLQNSGNLSLILWELIIDYLLPTIHKPMVKLKEPIRILSSIYAIILTMIRITGHSSYQWHNLPTTMPCMLPPKKHHSLPIMGIILPFLENHSTNNSLPIKLVTPLKPFNNCMLSYPRILIL